MVLAAKAVKGGMKQTLIPLQLGTQVPCWLRDSSLWVVSRISIVQDSCLPCRPLMEKGFDMTRPWSQCEKYSPSSHQYAVLGSFYAKMFVGISKPRVGLLNNGTESSKGDPLRKETYDLLVADESLNFVGNVEARDLMNGVADVVVTDGFTGNAVLKSIEGTALGIMGLLKMLLRVVAFERS